LLKSTFRICFVGFIKKIDTQCVDNCNQQAPKNDNMKMGHSLSDIIFLSQVDLLLDKLSSEWRAYVCLKKKR